MNKHFIYTEDFLDEGICQKLVKYFDENITINNNSNVNHAFDNRVIYYEGVKDPNIKALMKQIHDSVATKLKKFYNITDQPVLPEATHIVKWPKGSSLSDHADNSYADGRPNYVSWRTYSAVVYLNDDYTGGEFYFKRWPYTPIKPKTGLLVGFGGGMDFVHGVRKVKSGNRYALPMWFCATPEKAYPAYK